MMIQQYIAYLNYSIYLKDCSENAKAKKELLKEMEEEMSGEEEDVQDSSDSGL